MVTPNRQHRENHSDMCICNRPGWERFSLDQRFRFEFSELSSGEWQRISRNFWKRGQPCKADPHFRKFLTRNFCYTGFFCLFVFCFFFRNLRNPLSSHDISKIEQFLNFPEYFQGNCHTISPWFDCSAVFWWNGRLFQCRLNLDLSWKSFLRFFKCKTSFSILIVMTCLINKKNGGHGNRLAIKAHATTTISKF